MVPPLPTSFTEDQIVINEGRLHCGWPFLFLCFPVKLPFPEVLNPFLSIFFPLSVSSCGIKNSIDSFFKESMLFYSMVEVTVRNPNTFTL
jgi:hypothetical protein